MVKKEAVVPAVIPEAELPVVDSNATWGAAEEIESSDLLVGKIYHQQALSKFVQDGQAQPGDWCDSLTGEVLAKRDAPLDVIIFSSFKRLLISAKLPGSNKYEFQEAQEVTLQNCNLPWEEETPNGSIKRQLQYSYFCLIPGKELDLPLVLSLSSTKIKVAKKLNTMIAKLARLNRPSASVIFQLKSVKETGDKGSWFGAEVTQGAPTTKDQLQAAHDWYKQIKASTVVVAEEHGDHDTAVTTDDDTIPF